MDNTKLFLALGIVAVFFVVVVIFIIIVLKKIKETDPTNVDSSMKLDAATAQKFLPFETVKDSRCQ